MEFTKLEHIGIAVSNLKESIKTYELLSGYQSYKIEEVLSEKVRTAFFNINGNKLELLEAIDESSVIAKFINKKGEGLHHIAYEVDNIYKAMASLKQKGFNLLSDKPKIGADNKLICFVHPKDALGVLIELCQEITTDHIE